MSCREESREVIYIIYMYINPVAKIYIYLSEWALGCGGGDLAGGGVCGSDHEGTPLPPLVLPLFHYRESG